MESLEKIFNTAQLCSEIAIKMSLNFKHGIDPQSLKNDKSWVTSADQQIEKELRKIILKNHPTHFIFGEEEGGELGNDEDAYTWILDPIDGTFSFVHNIPFYSSLIAVLKGKTPIIGFACLPAMGITMSALKGQGAFINGEKYIKPPLVGNPNIEIVATADPYRFYIEQKGEILQTLYGPQIKTRTYPDALGYYMLLKGSVRAFIDPKVEIWDVAPFHVIMPEAGFAIQSWNENKDLQRGSSIAFPIDMQKMPINCSDILELTKRFA
ncbi:inositol monophosphatase family protein [Fluviispira sanaruensis]|uniref:Histidinol phosphate phosphatase n=1 Tax=Fluviispira sanaruensis TaxID=2493639 RepID=A0A4V0P237_FLUSA|nr:inositol monophosphatase [Fluviispira sanaruensis]BBH51867.1 histidinol phosphate phosphatase [Fluviispira sanaruensis]